jgi:SAM-dependent methyltransferase
MSDLYANWARVYDYFYPPRSDEVGFWALLAEPYGLRVLDLMCGTAEVSLGLARRGYLVLGVDLSPAMLAMAAQRLVAAADRPARNLSLVRADACAIPVSDADLDFVMVGGDGSFNHLDDDLASLSLREARRVLRSGGGLGMELVNPHLLGEIYPEWTLGPLRSTPSDVWLERTSFNHLDQDTGFFHIHQETRFEIMGERGAFTESFALRVWEPDGLRDLLAANGFSSVHFYGDYGLGAFDRWSANLLVVARATAQRSSRGTHSPAHGLAS